MKDKFKSSEENLKAVIDSLKTFLNEDYERSVSFKKFTSPGEPDDIVSFWEPIIANQMVAKFATGAFWYGSIHTHPIGYHEMFSWQDVNNLLDLY